MNKNIKIAVAALLILLGLFMMIFTRNLGWGLLFFFLPHFQSYFTLKMSIFFWHSGN